MLIRALRARNFMRFERIELSDVPEAALIGVEGPNESGKSTIGEAILFAFYGRTLSTASTGVGHLIRWGADSLEVEVDFGVPGSGEYRIHREIDKFGTNFVKVVEAESRRELATGNIQVAKLIGRLLRCDYFEFLRSFFLGQETAGHPENERERFAERLTGVAHLREAILAIRKEIEANEREFGQFQKEIQRNRIQMEKYIQNVEKLADLRESARAKRQSLESLEARARDLTAGIERAQARAAERERAAKRLESFGDGEGTTGDLLREYDRLVQTAEGTARETFQRIAEGLERLAGLEDALGGLESRLDAYGRWLRDDLNEDNQRGTAAECRRRENACEEAARGRRRGLGLSLVGLLVALVFGGLAAAVHLGKIPTPIRVGSTAIEGDAVFWVGAGIGLVGIVVFLWGLARCVTLSGVLRGQRSQLESARGRIRATRDELGRVEGAIEGRGDCATFLSAVTRTEDQDLRARVAQVEEAYGALVAEPDPRRSGAVAWAAKERELAAEAVSEAARKKDELGGLEGETRKARSARDRAESELRECENQGAKKEALDEKNEDLASRAAAVKAEIDKGHQAIELLNETIGAVESRVGPALSKFVRGVLPRLTAGRYKDLRIDAKLAIEIFTGRKCDFLDGGELSGGTREALELALRLAFAQAFIDSRVKQPQFIFLDEPFQKMDEGRSLESLRAIRSLSAELRQVFVVQPRFTDDQRSLLDRRVELRADADELVLHLSAPGSAPAPSPAPGPAPEAEGTAEGQEGGEPGPGDPASR
ncbi:MAG: AAA family ATPase [Planctomycetes bacterium]|nr:AAA family ATPase [Planctomycetota bacterium]